MNESAQHSPASQIEAWYLDNLVCPVDRSPLRSEPGYLVSAAGRRYPVVEGVPVMLRDDVQQTQRVAHASLEAPRGATGGDRDPLYLDTVGISPREKEVARHLHGTNSQWDPVVSVVVGATSGYAYKHLIGKIESYPIPKFRFPGPGGGKLLDIGCNWGRWTLAAAREGYEAAGIDPSLGAVLAARRVAMQLGLNAHFVVGDARHLPFRDGSFDHAWSYSVLQHFAKENAVAALREVRRAVKPGGLVRIQMANAFGVRSLYHLARRRFREPTNFEVRYWTPRELKSVYASTLGPTVLSADCYLGLGLQWSDFGHMSAVGKSALLVSETLRRASEIAAPLRAVADSVFCTSRVA